MIKTIHIFPFSSYIYRNEKSFYNFGPQTCILAVYKYSRRLLTRALPLKFEVIIFRYDFLMTGYSFSNFNLLESHIAQFHIGFKKCFFFFKRRTLRSETIFGNWKRFKNDKECFFFMLKALFVLKIFKFLS